MNNYESVFKRVAIGVVLTPNELVRSELDIIVTESVASVEANYTDNIDDTTQGIDGIKGIKTNYSGDLLSEVAVKGTTITATWLNGGSNRTTAPNVQAGETVELYRMGDSDKYYWRGLFYEADLRGKELAIFTFSNIDREGGNKTKVDHTNSYYVLFDTINKSFQLHTSKNDGEPMEWDIYINAKLGSFTIKNDSGDKLVMTKGKIEHTTKEYVVNCDSMTVNANKSYSLNTKASTIEGGKHEVKSGMTISGSSLDVNSVSSFLSKVSLNLNALIMPGSPGSSRPVI